MKARTKIVNKGRISLHNNKEKVNSGDINYIEVVYINNEWSWSHDETQMLGMHESKTQRWWDFINHQFPPHDFITSPTRAHH